MAVSRTQGDLDSLVREVRGRRVLAQRAAGGAEGGLTRRLRALPSGRLGNGDASWA